MHIRGERRARRRAGNASGGGAPGGVRKSSRGEMCPSHAALCGFLRDSVAGSHEVGAAERWSGGEVERFERWRGGGITGSLLSALCLSGL